MSSVSVSRMAAQTCCMCCPLRIGTKIIAALYLVQALYAQGATIFNLISLANKDSDSDSLAFGYQNHMRRFNEDYSGLIRSTLIIGFFLNVAQIIFSYKLYLGASRNDESNCKPWLFYNTILTTVAVFVCSIFGVYASTLNLQTGIMILAIVALSSCFYGYILSVVYRFIKQLREESQCAEGNAVWYDALNA